MKDILKGFFDTVFSFGGFALAVCIMFILILTAAIEKENAEKALTKATTKACYDGGLIKVDTDAGFYCVAPANLVKVKVKS